MTIRAALACAAALLTLSAAATESPERKPMNRASAQTKESAMSDDAPLQISGDRNPPPRVPPVEKDGVRYEQNLHANDAEFGQHAGVLVARNVKTNKPLWSLKIYDNRRVPGLEGDVQDVYFQSMAFDGEGRLLIENELGRRFAVDVVARTVKPLH